MHALFLSHLRRTKTFEVTAKNNSWRDDRDATRGDSKKDDSQR